MTPPSGWCRVDPRPWTKCRARWAHVSGFRAEHCGHPTALWPWALYDQSGEMHCYGAVVSGDRTHGYAWRSLDEVFRYVAIVLRGGDPVREFFAKTAP